MEVENNALLSCSSRFLCVLQQNRTQARLLCLLIIAKKTYSFIIYLYFSLSVWKLNVFRSIANSSSTLTKNQRCIFFFFFFFFFPNRKPSKSFIRFQSCAAIQQEWPQAESGYYWITIGRREVQVYCDMTNYGKPNSTYSFQARFHSFVRNLLWLH